MHWACVDADDLAPFAAGAPPRAQVDASRMARGSMAAWQAVRFGTRERVDALAVSRHPAEGRAAHPPRRSPALFHHRLAAGTGRNDLARKAADVRRESRTARGRIRTYRFVGSVGLLDLRTHDDQPQQLLERLEVAVAVQQRMAFTDAECRDQAVMVLRTVRPRARRIRQSLAAAVASSTPPVSKT